MHFFTENPDDQKLDHRQFAHTTKVETVEGVNANLFGFADMVQLGYKFNFAEARCSFSRKDPKTGREEIIPFDFDSESSSFIARAIISPSPKIAAKIVDGIMTKIRNGKEWRWFSGNYLSSSPATAWMTSGAKRIGTSRADLQKRLRQQLENPKTCIEQGVWITPSPGQFKPIAYEQARAGKHDKPDESLIIHGGRMRSRKPTELQPEGEHDPGEECEVGSIQEEKYNGEYPDITDHKYRIRWKGFTKSDDTWEPAEGIQKSVPLIVDKWNRKKTVTDPDALRDLANSPGNPLTDGPWTQVEEHDSLDTLEESDFPDTNYADDIDRPARNDPDDLHHGIRPTKDGSSMEGITDESADPRYYSNIMESMDTSTRAVKAHLPPREKKLSALEMHIRMGHTGDAHGCEACKRTKGAIRRIYAKRDPFIALQPGKFFSGDIVTFDERSRQGHHMAWVGRDIATGWYFPLLWLENKDDLTGKLESAVLRLRDDPKFSRLPWPLMQNLRLDPGGEQRNDNVSFQKMLTRLHIEAEYSSPHDKRSNSHAEAAIKHLTTPAKAMLAGAALPAAYIEDAMEQVRRVRNCSPLRKNLVTKDGSAPTPWEEVSKGTVSRAECQRVLHHAQPIGTPALLFDSKVKGSSLRKTKGKWGVFISMERSLPLFLNPWTNQILRCKDYFMYTLRRGQGFFEFFGIDRPSDKAIPFNQRDGPPIPKSEGDMVIKIHGLHKLMGAPPPEQDNRTVTQRGVDVTGIYVVPEGEGMQYVTNSEGELVPFRNTNTRQPTPETESILQDEEITPPPDRSRDGVIKSITEDPTSIVNTIYYKLFTSEDTNVWDKYPCAITGIAEADDAIAGDVGSTLWKVSYGTHADPGTIDTRNMIHHVVDSYITDINGAPDEHIAGEIVLSEMRPAASNAAVSADMDVTDIAAKKWSPDKVNTTPYAHLRQKKGQVINIHARRNCRWNKDLPEFQKHVQARLFTVDGTVNFVHACDQMGIETRHRRLYYNWLGVDFGHNARPPNLNGFGCRFLNPWEGERKQSSLPPGCQLIRPNGSSWRQWIEASDRENRWHKYESTNHAQDADLRKAEESAMIKVFMAHEQHKESRYTTIVDLNPTGNVGEPTTWEGMCAYTTSRAYAVSAKTFAKHLGVKENDPRIISITDKKGNIKHPFNAAEARGRIDEKHWTESWRKEWSSIIERKIFSERISLEEARRRGITANGVPCRTVNEIKRHHDGSIAKWKSRFVIQGHQGRVTKGVHYWDTFSAAPNIATTRILQCLAVLGWCTGSVDIETAFLWGRLPKEEHMAVSLPHEKGTVRILEGNLYGLPQADRVYTEARDKFILTEFNKGNWTCTQAQYDPCLFMFHHDGKRMFCVIHTDDVDCVAQSKEDMAIFFAALNRRFRVKPGDPKFMLGLQRKMSKDGKSMEITMEGFVNDLYDEYKQHFNKSIPPTPFPPRLFLTKPIPETRDPVAEKELIKRGFQSAVGSILWAARNCYPEAAVGVQYLCRQMSMPTEEGWKAAMHMIRYFKGKSDQGIKFTRTDKPRLVVYYDASNKSDTADGQAIGGHVAMLLGGPIEWSSKKLPADTPGQSAHHNEYMSLAQAAKTTQWLRSLIIEMGFEDWVKEPTKVYGDNDAATQLAREGKLTIENRYYVKEAHFSKQAFQHGIINPVRVPGTENLADGLTKALPRDACEKLNPMLKGYVPISKESAPPGRPYTIQARDLEDTLDSHITDKDVRERLHKDAEANIYKDRNVPATVKGAGSRVTPGRATATTPTHEPKDKSRLPTRRFRTKARRLIHASTDQAARAERQQRSRSDARNQEGELRTEANPCSDMRTRCAHQGPRPAPADRGRDGSICNDDTI